MTRSSVPKLRTGSPEARVLEYVRTARLEYVQRGPRSPITLAELASLLGIDRRACSQALNALTGSGEIETLIHPGARYELRPGRASRRS